MVTTVTAYALVVLFFVLEGVLRKGRAASSVLAAYCFRIGAEEWMLTGMFGEEYEQYRRSTWRMIPFLF